MGKRDEPGQVTDRWLTVEEAAALLGTEGAPEGAPEGD